MTDVLLSERPTAKVGLLTLNRPDRLNAMTSELCTALHGELEAIAADRARRLHPHRRLQLRHGGELAPAPADRRVALTS
jgi:hypothetical protein